MQPHNIFFRAGVGVIIHRMNEGQQQVAFFERIDEPGHWQFPQGGMYQGESPLESMWRELGEETGLKETDILSVHEVPFLVSYTYPRSVADSLAATGSHYIGQTQRWFILDLAENIEIDLSKASDKELSAVQWIEPNQAISEIVDFKRSEYEQLIEYFKQHVK